MTDDWGAVPSCSAAAASKYRVSAEFRCHDTRKIVMNHNVLEHKASVMTICFLDCTHTVSEQNILIETPSSELQKKTAYITTSSSGHRDRDCQTYSTHINVNIRTSS